MQQSELDRLVRNAIDAHLGRANPSQIIPATARAAVLVEPGRLEFRRFALREPLEGEILVRVEACGICGTDIHCYNGDPFGLCPVVLGHEGTGEVVALGKNVRIVNGQATPPNIAFIDPTRRIRAIGVDTEAAELADVERGVIRPFARAHVELAIGT